MLTVVPGAGDGGERAATDAADDYSLIDSIVREGARRMLAEALQAEVEEYIARFADCRDEVGGDWWCATARPSPARCSPRPARCR